MHQHVFGPPRRWQQTSRSCPQALAGQRRQGASRPLEEYTQVAGTYSCSARGRSGKCCFPPGYSGRVCRYRLWHGPTRYEAVQRGAEQGWRRADTLKVPRL